VCASQKAEEEGVSQNYKITRFENKSARGGTKREKNKKKGALKARTCPTSSKLAHMLLTAAIVTAKFWCG
jgi:hypothetical protein